MDGIILDRNYAPQPSDQENNDLFKRFIPQLVMVIVDVRSQAVGMPKDAYFAVEEIKDVCRELFNLYLRNRN